MAERPPPLRPRDGHEVAALYFHPDGDHYVVIERDTQRDWYRFAECSYSDVEREQCWIPRDFPSICDSFETALREAKGRIPWLDAMLCGDQNPENDR